MCVCEILLRNTEIEEIARLQERVLKFQFRKQQTNGKWHVISDNTCLTFRRLFQNIN